MISIVTGTLNRIGMLPALIQNTVMSDERIELVLVDGGSTDGTIEYIKSLENPQIKLIEVGGLSLILWRITVSVESKALVRACRERLICLRGSSLAWLRGLRTT